MHTARRTHGFTESVIRGMTRLANAHGAINLAQGFPNFPCPDVLKEAAARAVRADLNQYAITWGAKRLRDAVARKYADWYGLAADPETEVTVTCGATEAMASSVLALVDPGGQTVSFPYLVDEFGLEGRPMPVTSGLTGYILRTGKPLLDMEDPSRRWAQDPSAAGSAGSADTRSFPSSRPYLSINR